MPSHAIEVTVVDRITGAPRREIRQRWLPHESIALRTR
jgi:hypothetical protein